MGRIAATAVHLALCTVAGVLYFLFVLPRWWELMGDTSPALGTAMRIVVGLLFALSALPVILTLIRTRKPELNTSEWALALRLRSAGAHLVAGVLVVATAVTEIWVTSSSAGPWLYGVYGGAATLQILGIFGFYLAFVAELPPKPKKSKALPAEETDSADADSDSDSAESDETATSPDAESAESDSAEILSDAEAGEESTVVADEPAEAAPSSGLQNKRPTGKTGHRLRRRERVAVED